MPGALADLRQHQEMQPPLDHPHLRHPQTPRDVGEVAATQVLEQTRQQARDNTSANSRQDYLLRAFRNTFQLHLRQHEQKQRASLPGSHLDHHPDFEPCAQRSASGVPLL